MYHTIPLVVMGMQLGTALVSLHLSLEDVVIVNSQTSGSGTRAASSDPTAVSQFIIDIILDIVAVVCGASNHLCLLCLFSVISVLFTATALNVVCLFASLIRLIIVSLRRYHWIVPSQEDPASFMASQPTRTVTSASSYPLMKPNTMRFILSLFTNGVLFFTSLYLVVVVLCLIKRKTSNMSQALVLLFNPIRGEVTWQPKKYGRLIPVFGTLLALSGCVCLMGFVMEATILLEEPSIQKRSPERGVMNHWSGLYCGMISLLAGIFTVLSVICKEPRSHFLAFASVLLTLVTLVTSTLALHSEHFLFAYLEEKLTVQPQPPPQSSSSNNNNMDLMTYRHFLLTKVTLVTFACVFNYIFAVPLLAMLGLHIANQRRIHLLTCSVASSQPPSYRDYSQPELVPMESSIPLMDMTESGMFMGRKQARYAAAAAAAGVGSGEQAGLIRAQTPLGMVHVRNPSLSGAVPGVGGGGLYAVPCSPGGVGPQQMPQNRLAMSPDSASSSFSARRMQPQQMRQQSPLPFMQVSGVPPGAYNHPMMMSAGGGGYFHLEDPMQPQEVMPYRWSTPTNQQPGDMRASTPQQQAIFYNNLHSSPGAEASFLDAFSAGSGGAYFNNKPLQQQMFLPNVTTAAPSALPRQQSQQQSVAMSRSQQERGSPRSDESPLDQ